MPYLTVDGSSRRLGRPAAAVLESLKLQVGKRGFHLAAQYPAKDGSGAVLYKFQGDRQPVVVGAMDTDEAGNINGAVQSYGIGSVFYAVVHSLGPSQTDLLVVGKPTWRGTELCSDADALLKSFQYWCVDTTGRNMGPLVASLSGKAESETIQGVLSEVAQER